MTKKQPDFQATFFGFFSDSSGGVSYRIRGDSNLRHDIAFMSGLLHDGRFNVADVRRRAKAISIDLDRDRWELPRPNDSDNRSLLSIRSRLTIGSVVQDEFTHSPSGPLLRENLTISGVEAQELYSARDPWKFIIIGENWRWVFSIPEFQFKIELADGPRRKRRN